MKTHETLDDLKINHIIDQLHEFGYTETDGLSPRELAHKLAVVRAMEVEIKPSHNSWF